MTRVCQRCGAQYQDWVAVCADCGARLDDPGEDEAESEIASRLSIEFTLLSGETVSVRAELEDPPTEESVRAYAQDLIRDIGSDEVRTFSYWWEGEFYVDAVRMREVAALSVSTVASEDDVEEWEE